MQQNVDWHQIWKNTMENCTGLGRESGTLKQWTVSEAERFLKKSGEQYVELLMQKIKATSGDKVMDIGCGPGRLTIPLAKIAESVTAVDTSQGMLEVVKRRAKEEGLDNITYVNKFWLEVVPGKDIQKSYDITLASNCINLLAAKEIQVDHQKQLDWNLNEALQKIDAVGKTNYLTMPVMHHKGFSEIHEILEKEYHPFPSFIHVHNVLYQLGIRPEIDYFSTHCKRQSKPENVIERLGWVHDITEEQKERIEEKIFSSENKADDTGLQVWATINWSQNQLN
jgi:SAM-dependent methyltransferase